MKLNEAAQIYIAEKVEQTQLPIPTHGQDFAAGYRAAIEAVLEVLSDDDETTHVCSACGEDTWWVLVEQMQNRVRDLL